MNCTDEVVYQTAEAMAAELERVFEYALSVHFGKTDWTEADARQLAMSINVHSDGSEELWINQRRIVRIGPLRTEANITDGRVMCQFSREITWLNEGGQQ